MTYIDPKGNNKRPHRNPVKTIKKKVFRPRHGRQYILTLLKFEIQIPLPYL